MDNQKEIEDKLWKIFANVNDWLKIAEAKNAMLIGFNGASIFGISRIMTEVGPWLWGYLLIVCIILCFSVLISFFAFIPRLKGLPPGIFYNSRVKNIYYFEYLKTLNYENLLHELDPETKKFELPDSIKHLADQIISNANIASRKYSNFTVAIWITICGIVTPILGGIFFGYWYSNQIKI
jgi:hypothetical protein